ncbi:MAG: iron complex outerrane recepter protein [Gammaproteobacteria bacterium]|nr:iron complex outerrane recepter protein [Gammaproteobacteria bacterium]
MTSLVQDSRYRLSVVVLATSGALVPLTALGEATGNAVLEEIVVTAQKRTEDVQDVPAAVTAISSQLLEDLHATQLTDVGGYVPSLQVNSAGTPGQTSLSIRGIAPVGPGATVATYIDDTPIGSSSAYGGGIAFALDLLPYDMQRIEVLRGPQGTLYGASSMGGLLKYVLTTPSLDHLEMHAGGDVFGMSSAGKAGGGGRMTLSGPVIDGKLGVTASYASEYTPGFIDNSVTGEADQNAYRQQSGRLGLLWSPSDALSVKLNALYQKTDAEGNGSIALDSTTLQPLVGGRNDNNLTPQPFEKDIQYFTAAIDYKLLWADFVSATSYSKTRTDQTQDASYTYGVAFPAFGFPAGTSQYRYVLHLKKYTQEFRLQSPTGAKLEWLGGLFWTYEDSGNYQSPTAMTLEGAPIPEINPIFTGQLPSTYREYAGFGDLTYHLTDAFDLLGGVRYSKNYQVFSEFASSPVITPVDLPDQKSNEGVTTYNVAAKYRFAPDWMAYVRVASGYQPGGPNLAIPGVPQTFRSDRLTNYEIGLKSELFDRRLLVDVDGFYIAWKDIQLLSNGAGFSYGTNGGTAKSEGIEANVSFRPIDRWTFEGTFSYVDAVLTEDVPQIGGVDGDRLPNIPRFSGSLRATYSRPLPAGWVGTLGAGVRAQDRRYSDVNGASDSRPLPGYSALDLQASLSNDRYTIRLFGKNITDKRAYLTYSPQVNQAFGNITQFEAAVLQPRVVGVSLDVKF